MPLDFHPTKIYKSLQKSLTILEEGMNEEGVAFLEHTV